MVINTYFTEPGFNIGVARKFAEVRTTVDIMETTSNRVVATLSAAGPGRTYGGYAFEYRIACF